MNELELIQVGALLLQFPWQSFDVSFDHAICNFDPLAPGKNSIVAFADNQTQATMGALADAIEDYLLKNGKPSISSTFYMYTSNLLQYIEFRDDVN